MKVEFGDDLLEQDYARLEQTYCRVVLTENCLSSTSEHVMLSDTLQGPTATFDLLLVKHILFTEKHSKEVETVEQPFTWQHLVIQVRLTLSMSRCSYGAQPIDILV